MAGNSPPLVQWSIREVLALTLFVGLALAGLPLAGGIVWGVAVTLAVVICTAQLIILFVGRQEIQASAIGFVIPVVVYGGIVLATGSDEWNPHRGNLPTSMALGLLSDRLAEVKWVDQSGQEVPDFDPATQSLSGMTRVTLSQPAQGKLMALGHLLFALAFGYVGGEFAVAVYRCRKQTDAANNAQG